MYRKQKASLNSTMNMITKYEVHKAQILIHSHYSRNLSYLELHHLNGFCALQSCFLCIENFQNNHLLSCCEESI